MIKIRCVVERITYQNPENGYTVLKCAVKNYNDLVTVVGNLVDVNVGSVLLIDGNWKVDAKYGRQFLAESWEETMPATVFGIEKYLGSGLIKGVGPKFAKKIVQQFGTDTLEIIETDVKRLLEVPGIGKKRVDKIAESWERQKEIKNVILFLQDHGVSTAFAAKIYRQYGNESIQKVRENPFRLADDIWGIGFKTADSIAMKLGIGKEAFIRLRSGIMYTLSELADEGHVYAEREQLIRKASELLEAEDTSIIMTMDQMLKDEELIREKIMRNHLGGLNASAAYSVRKLDLAFGGSYSYYSCPHWGVLDWVDGLEGSQIGGRWYDNDVDKHDANLFARANWSVAKGLRLFADLQYRYVSYQAWGVNDNYVSEEVGMQPIDVDKQYHFFNPRAGVSYTLAERNNFYLSFAVAQKEPTRSDFTDRYKIAADDTSASTEKIYDWELGYQYTAPRLSLGVNLYYMKYKDQLVPTGMVNDDSNALNTNVPDSYRRGVELSASWRATGWFTVGANATFSQNRIENYVDALKDSPTYGKELGDMTIAYSPDVIANAFLNFHHRGFEAVFHTQHVGKQYFTNNENDALSLDAYCVTNLNLAYTFRTRSARSVRLGLLINNLFNAEYESNGYGYSYMDTWSGPAPVRIDEAYYFPQAPLNVLANVTVKF